MLKKNEHICPQIDSHRNVDGSFTHNGQKHQTTQLPIKKMKKQILVWLYDKLVLNNKSQTNDTLNNMAESQNHYVEQK